MARRSERSKQPIKSIETAVDRTTVIAVTVSDYRYLPGLAGPRNDSRTIQKIFVDDAKFACFDKSQFRLVENPNAQAFRDCILDYVETRSASGDVLVLYFSGHGCVIESGQFGFCLTDTRMMPGGDTVLPLSAVLFRDVIHTLVSANVHPVFIVDACYSATIAYTGSIATTSRMHDELQNLAGGSYGLICSSSSDQTSLDLDDGGVFTQALYSVIKRGIGTDAYKYWPTLTLRNLVKPVQEAASRMGYRLPRFHVSPDLPDIPVARNTKYREDVIVFGGYLSRIIELLWNGGSPQQATLLEIQTKISTAAYANHSKLSLAPWRLLEDGTGGNRSRRLTKRGEEFAARKITIPSKIIRDSKSDRWIRHPDSHPIRYEGS